MLAMIFLILSAAWIVLAIIVILADEPGASAFILAGVFVFNVYPIFTHIHDLALIRNSQSLYNVRESAITRISEELKSLPGQTALMNADSPAKSLIETKSRYVTDLIELKMDVENSKISIERKKMGPSAWVVWLLGDK